MIRILSMFAMMVIVAVAQVQNPAAKDRLRFESRLSAIERLAERERWKDAKRCLDHLLESHAGRAYVFEDRDRILALARECAFRSSSPGPAPGSLISGKLLYYRASTGALKVRYGAGRADFERGRRDRYARASTPGPAISTHPAVFTGPYKITIKGTDYPRTGSGPVLKVCTSGDAWITVVFGSPRQTFGTKKGGGYIRGTPAGMYAWQGGHLDILDERPTSPGRVGKEYVIQVRVDKSSVRATYNNRVVLTARRSRRDWGRAGFAPISGIREVTLEGKTDGTWLGGLIAKETERRHKAFDASYRPQDHLPSWLLPSVR